MGLFDFFKGKKEKKGKNLPPAFQQAIEVLFPNGTEDHTRQLNELCDYFGSKYEKEYIDNNLIFILSGHLITGIIRTKEKAVASVLNRVNNKMVSADVEYLYDFAIQNHPKLSLLTTIETISATLSEDGGDEDIISGGYGLFGYSPTNPIPTNGVIGIYDYLSRLYDVNNAKVTYTRIGTITNEISRHPIDEFQISSAKGVDTLYFSCYQKKTSRLSPRGYILLDENGQTLPTANDDNFSVKEENHKNPVLPLLGLASYACTSSEELVDKDCVFKEAEKYNKKAIVLANKGEFEGFFEEGALEILDKAILLQSLNAVNNKFTVLFTMEKYNEGYKYLESIVDTPHVSLRGLYNLAVLYYNADYYTDYDVNKDIVKAYTLLLKAADLPNDDREENREYTRKKVVELISQLEEEDASLLQKKGDIMSGLHGKDELKSPAQTDIYGEKLINKLSIIYSCIKSAAENVLKSMDNLPEPSERGKLEVEIVMAAILSRYVDRTIILQSLFSGNPKFYSIDMTDVLSSIDSYRGSYENHVLSVKTVQRVPLMEFYRTHGKLQLWDNKYPVFVKEGSEPLICRFAFFDEEKPTTEFVAKNKNNIFVDYTEDGEYLFRLKKDIDYLIDVFLKMFTWNIYFSEGASRHIGYVEDIENDLKAIKRRKTKVIVASDISELCNLTESDFEESSNIIPDMRYAFNEGSKTLMAQVVDNGIIESK